MTRKALMTALVWGAFLMLAAPVFAQGGSAAWTPEVYQWAMMAGGGALALAAAVGAYSQSRAVSAACDGISRNPGASPQIRFALLLGLVLIESLVIYVFVIALSIIFVKWGVA
ncbi:MAG TPA: ATP synthase F0 subunit C [Vicinamibacteria bacterium]